MTGKRAVLQVLRAADPDRGASGAELEAVAGRRFGARILELRRDGHEIETIRPTNGGDFRYRMLRDAGYQRATTARTQLDGGPAALTGSSASIDHGPAPASSPPGGAPQDLPLFEVPAPAPRSALLEDAA